MWIETWMVWTHTAVVMTLGGVCGYAVALTREMLAHRRAKALVTPDWPEHSIAMREPSTLPLLLVTEDDDSWLRDNGMRIGPESS